MLKRIIKFGIVGMSGVIIGLGIITLAVEVFNINPRFAWYISTFFATLNNFLLNNFFTWKERRAEKPREFTQKISLYYLFAFLSIALNFFLYNILLDRGLHYFLALLIAIGTCATLNFAVNELFIWPKKTSGSQSTEGRL